MNPPNSSQSGRCGMCGSCGSMPPWAPERLKNTSPEARLALERRMKEAQKRFIELRDAKRALHANAPEDETSPEPYDQTLASSIPRTENEVQTSDTIHQDHPRSYNEDVHDTLRNEWNTSELPASQPIGQLHKQLPRQLIRTQLATEPELENEDADRTTFPNVTPLECGGDIEDDAVVDIPLTPLAIPSQPPNYTSYEASEAVPDFEASQLAQSGRRKQQRFSSPVILESPTFPNTTELGLLPEVSLGPNHLSEPLRTISLREADSDAESFHTAEGEDGARRSADNLPVEDEKESENDIAPIVGEVEWQAFQDESHDREPEVAAKVSESAGSVSAISSTDEDASLEGFTREISTSGQPISEVENLGSKPDENRENSTATTPSPPPKPTENAVRDDYTLPADPVQPNEITVDPTPCEDCERWRERVRELEFKVEALTSALTAREMESASMRARVADRRYSGKSATQLMEECESLRITTEYLYHKLERYERKLNGSHPAVH